MRLFALLFSMAIILTSCGTDDDDTTVVPTSPLVLNHDGENETSPNLTGDTYELAAKFESTTTSAYTGKSLLAVQLYVQNVADTVVVKVYDEGTSESEPGALLSSKTVTNDLVNNSWNTVSLDDAVSISGNDLWISVYFKHSGSNQTIGCDPGPAVTNGDWMYQESTGNWTTFRAFTSNSASINWNIRGVLGK